MKKYPVIYKGKKYEVRWTQIAYIDRLIVYQVYKIFGIKFFERIYRMDEYDINFELMHESKADKSNLLPKETPEYRIEQVKCLFRNMEKDLYKIRKEQELKTQQKQALKEWDGVIDDVN